MKAMWMEPLETQPAAPALAMPSFPPTQAAARCVGRLAKLACRRSTQGSTP